MTIQNIVLGGGCFWCIESVFNNIIGVHSAVSGYAGGQDDHPTYEKICTGNSGHAEVVKVSYDSSVISLEELLKVFFTIHDPTTLNRQGNDIGSQYRSVIFYNSEEERQVAEQIITDLNRQAIFQNKIVTQLEELKTFFPAEDYHQEYFKKNPGNPYCQYSIPPKKKKILEKFPDYLK